MLWLAAVTAQASGPVEERPTIDVAMTLGLRWVQPDGWDEFVQQQSIGANLSWRRPAWPLFLALDAHAGGKTNSEYDPNVGGTVYTNDATHVEFALGLRRIGYSRKLIYDLGSGLAWAYGGYGKDTVRVSPGGAFPQDSDSGFGPWAEAGLRFRFTDFYSAGVGARITSAHGTLYDRRVDLGGWQACVTFVGMTLPKRPKRQP